MNDNTVCCQNVSATEPQRDPRQPAPNTMIFTNGGSNPPPYNHQIQLPPHLFPLGTPKRPDADASGRVVYLIAFTAFLLD